MQNNIYYVVTPDIQPSQEVIKSIGQDLKRPVKTIGLACRRSYINCKNFREIGEVFDEGVVSDEENIVPKKFAVYGISVDEKA